MPVPALMRPSAPVIWELTTVVISEPLTVMFAPAPVSANEPPDNVIPVESLMPFSVTAASVAWVKVPLFPWKYAVSAAVKAYVSTAPSPAMEVAVPALYQNASDQVPVAPTVAAPMAALSLPSASKNTLAARARGATERRAAAAKRQAREIGKRLRGFIGQKVRGGFYESGGREFRDEKQVS